jgi:hypothetical protein
LRACHTTQRPAHHPLIRPTSDGDSVGTEAAYHPDGDSLLPLRGPAEPGSQGGPRATRHWQFLDGWTKVWSCERHADELPFARR